MSALTVFVDGIALWASRLPGWDLARAAFRGEGSALPEAARRPAPELLPPAERRRAPDSVALALEVARVAVAQSGHRPGELLSVFTSAHGDLAITDYMCATLASAPLAVSPTRFLNSVHNAAAGYWGIATASMQPATAVSAFECSFAAGMLEAMTQCVAEARPVLLVGCDTAACGPLVSTNDSRGLLAVALVLAPRRSAHSQAVLEGSLAHGPSARIPLRSEAALPLATNAMADALPLFESLAIGDAQPLAMPLSALLALRVQVRMPASPLRCDHDPEHGGILGR